MKSLLLFVSLYTSLAAATWRSVLDRAERLREIGDIPASEEAYQQVLEGAKSLGPVELNAVGIELSRDGRYRDAEWAYRRALTEWERYGATAATSRSITAANLGTLLQREGRYQDAEPFLLDRFRNAEATGGADSPDAGRAAVGLTSLYLAWGLPEKAEPFAAHANTILQQSSNDAEERLSARRMLGSVLLALGRYSEGATLLREILPDLPERTAVGVYDDLAIAESSQHHLAEAESLALKGLELARRVLPRNDRVTAVCLNNLAQIERFQGRYLEAEKNYREAIGTWEQALGPRHPDLAKGLMNLAAFYHERGREAGAEELYRRATNILETSYGKDHPLTLVARNELSEVLRAEHRYSEAQKLSRATLEPLEKTFGEQDPRVVRALENYTRLLTETRQLGKNPPQER